MMPKDGSSRNKRRARRLAIAKNLRYTEALRHDTAGQREPRHRGDSEATTEIGPSALDALHTAVERVAAADPADTAAALAISYEALSLTATANDLIHTAMLELGTVYWPGENFLAPIRVGSTWIRRSKNSGPR